MAFETQEISTESGQPVELYFFTQGAESFAYTSGEDQIIDGATTYEPIPITRSNISQGTEARQDKLTVTMPANVIPASRYIEIVPSSPAQLTIKRLHRTDTPTPQIVTIYQGTVRSVRFIEKTFKAQVTIVPLTNGSHQSVPRYTYQGLCGHFLYDSQCKVIKPDFKFTGNVSAVNGDVLTIPGLSAEIDQFYRNGIIQLGTTDRRMIMNHLGDDITIQLPFATSALNTVVDVFAGCDHTKEICNTKFANFINYGGFPYVPLKNPHKVGIE